MKKFLLLFCLLLSTHAFGGDEHKITLSPSRTILISGPISSVMYEPVMKTMGNLAETGKDIDIIISSPGGEVITGSLIIDYMEQLKVEGVRFRCIVRDLAASMAFQLLLHCDERYATPNSYLLWHPVRLFYQGPLTSEQASSLGVQLGMADAMVIHDLHAYLPMSDADILWHFQHETLHQAFNLKETAPGFFKMVTNSIANLRPKKVALDTSTQSNHFVLNQLIYIHERFKK